MILILLLLLCLCQYLGGMNRQSGTNSPTTTTTTAVPSPPISVETTVVVEEPKAGPVVPDVVGMTRSAAIAALANAGYVASITDVYGTSKPASTVIRQNPSGGATLELGGTVGLLVQLRPGSQRMVTVPKLTGLAQAVAEHKIRALGVKVVLSYAPKSRKWPAGIMRSQWPLPGHKVAVGGDIQIQITVKP